MENIHQDQSYSDVKMTILLHHGVDGGPYLRVIQANYSTPAFSENISAEWCHSTK